ncbi:hypothetical protein G9A89_023951 [Geosiphon pyriformis]|nr:hypothetical protein G9A89_023951 [Geosiphon pyriformis]
MTTTRAKSKKAVLDICLEISNKISTRGALSVVEATRQNVLEVFSLPSNCDKLPLVATEAISSSLAGFSPVKISLSVASIPTKSPKVFNNRPVNKLVFSSIDLTLGAASTTSSKKMVKKTKSSEKWGQLLAFAIVTPNSFVVLNEILDEISIVSSGTSSSLVLEAKQSPPVESPVLGNWADHMETELFPPLVSGATSDSAWETITSRQRFAGWVASILVLGATFKIKLAHVKAVFQSVHGFLGAKSVSKDNSLKAAFLVELTSFVHLVTLKIAKFLVVSESGSSLATVALHNVPLSVSAANIKTVFGVFGKIAHIVLKPASVWQYVVVYFKKLDAATVALNYWSILVSKDSVKILPVINQNEAILFRDRFKTKLVNLSSGCTAFEINNLDSIVVKTGTLRKYCIWWKTSGCWCCFRCQEVGHLAADYKVFLSPTPKVPKVFKSHFVGSALYAKTAAPFGLSEFPSLVAPLAASAADFAQISDLAALVKSIVEPIGFLVALVFYLFDDNAVKAVQIEKDIISMKSAVNNFANLMIGVSKDIACLRSEVDFGGMDYNGMLATKPFFLSEDTIKHIIAL